MLRRGLASLGLVLIAVNTMGVTWWAVNSRGTPPLGPSQQWGVMVWGLGRW